MNDEGDPKEFVVVTRARMRNSQRWITHAYGLYTRTKAKSVKSNAKKEAAAAGYEIEVSVCRVLDVERMNRDLIPETLRQAISNA